MTEFKKLLIANKISNAEAMKAFSISESTLGRYKSGRQSAPKHMIIILENMEVFNKAKTA